LNTSKLTTKKTVITKSNIASTKKNDIKSGLISLPTLDAI